jgi:MFS family permease
MDQLEVEIVLYRCEASAGQLGFELVSSGFADSTFGQRIASVVCMASNPNIPPTPQPRAAAVTPFPSQRDTERARKRGFIIAWAFTAIFYFLEYAARSSPSVMMPQLAAAFGTTALGVSSILVLYYYTYSITSLIAGASLDHLGAKRPIPTGIAILAVGCLLFAIPSVLAGDIGRLLQGVGSAFAFTGAVYLAVHGFPARYLATAIGATQMLGMLGGSAGQFAVGPMIQRGLGVKAFWIGMGVVCLVNAVLLYVVTPREPLGPHAEAGGLGGLLRPYKIVFSNPQSYLCGIVSGLLFAPTTIGAMIWAVPIFQKDIQLSYYRAVVAASMVPAGWVIGSPLFGWLSDRIGRRKPVIIAGAAIMALVLVEIIRGRFVALSVSMFIFGIASGVAMIPYSVIKEVNPDDVKGSATGGINFLVFGITAIIGPIFAQMIGKTIERTNHIAHFRAGGVFWIVCCVAAGVITFFLRETGHGARQPAVHK